VFKGDDRNTNILEELKRESSGILNRLYQGYEQWVTTTLKKPPPRVVGAVDEYKAESDVVARWIDMAGVEKNGDYDTIPASVVYRLFTDWHDANESGKPVSNTMFGRRMKALGMGSEKIGGNKVYVGLEIEGQDC
jgi:phage/plasmid-associated DNA primase